MKQPLLATTAIITISLLASFVSQDAVANPEGAQIISGATTISENGTKLNVHQHTNRTVIDWRSFNIAADEHTEFHQPTSSAIALNRINDINPSRIAGKLSSNGNIILVNPNGVFFEGPSRVDVNGIVATTANIKNDDFMAGNNHFNIPGNSDAVIINKGIITAKEAGLVGLVAPNVENRGIIQAKLGRVQLSSGDTVAVDFYGDNLLKVEVKDEEIKSQLVANSGVLSANGGTVAMTAAAAEKTVNSLIFSAGHVEAKSVSRNQSGTIIISGQGSSKTEKYGDSYVAVTGTLDASGRNEGEQGGKIDVLGDHIAISETALIDASGHSAVSLERKPNTGTAAMREDKTIDNGVRIEEDLLAQDSRAGGSIKIGGDYLGKGDTPTAKTVKVSEGALILNNALDKGDAGRTIVWSDDTTEFDGLVLATGGKKGGHGGFLETSGKINLKANGFADLSAQEGFSKGTYLLDPANITIYGSADGILDPNDIDAIDGDATDLQLWLDASDVTTITDTAGSVTTWADKANGYVFSDAGAGAEPTTGARTINSLNALDFDGGDRLINTADAATIFAPNSDIYTFFIGVQDLAGTDIAVYAKNGASGLQSGSSFNGSGGSGSTFEIHSGFNNTTVQNFIDDTNATAANSTPASPGAGNPTIVGGYFDRVSANAGAQSWVNGLASALETGDAAEDRTATAAIIGGHGSTNNSLDRLYDGAVGEVIIFHALTENERALVDQYQSVKWDIALNPLNNGDSELDQATAAGGYSAFSVEYLEKLSQGSDVNLLATNSITFDLDGDQLDVGSGQSITFTTSTTGSITDSSAGTIRTTGGGNITLDSADTINLTQTNLEAIGGGVVNLTSGGDTTVTQTSDLTLGTVSSNGLATLSSSGGNVTSTGAIASTTGSIDIDAGGLINLGSTVTSGANGIALDAATGINVDGAVDANGASATVTATNTTSSNITFGSTIDLEDGFTITNNGVGGNIDIAGAVLTNGGNSSLIAPNGTITTGAQIRNLSQDNITIDAQNDAVNPTIFLGGNLINYFGSGEIDIRDNMRLNSDARFYTGTLTLQDVNVNGFNLRLEPNIVLNLNGDISSNGGGLINFMTADASNTMNIGGSGVGFDYTNAIMNAIDLDSFGTINIGLVSGGGDNTTGTINLLSDLTADATINVNTDGVFNLGANLSTSGNQNITFTTDSGINVSSVANLDAGTGDITITTDGANEITTNNQLTVTTDNLISNDNFNGNLSWRVSGTGTTGTLVASAGSNITIEQETASDSIDISSITGGSDIGLSNAFLTLLSTNFDDFTFGRMDGGAIANYATSFAEDISILSNSTFTNQAALAMGANTLSVVTTGDIILNDDIVSTSAVADAITLSTADDFINNAGTDALQATNSNWIVFSDDPVGNQNNGLLPDESFYNQADLAATIASKTLVGNNVFGYNTATRPTLTYDVDDLSVEYGETLAALSTTYNSGLVGDDAIGAIGQVGAAVLSNTYTPGDNVALYASSLTGAVGTLTDALGYQYTFNAGDLTVTQAPLNASVTPTSSSRVEDSANPTFGISYTGFKLGETDAVIDTPPTVSTTAIISSAPGIYPVTLAGGLDNNYTFTYTNGTLEVTGAPVASIVPSTVEQDSVGLSLQNTPSVAQFSQTRTDIASLPNSKIDIEIEGFDEQIELESNEGSRRVMKLKIEKELADELDLTVKEDIF